MSERVTWAVWGYFANGQRDFVQTIHGLPITKASVAAAGGIQGKYSCPKGLLFESIPKTMLNHSQRSDMLKICPEPNPADYPTAPAPWPMLAADQEVDQDKNKFARMLTTFLKGCQVKNSAARLYTPHEMAQLLASKDQTFTRF